MIKFVLVSSGANGMPFLDLEDFVGARALVNLTQVAAIKEYNEEPSVKSRIVVLGSSEHIYMKESVSEILSCLPY